MASQSLYRKWRSQTFSDLVGQKEIVQTLKNALVSGNLSHAYLFTGPRGTGKTSTARLLAKTLNCTNSKNGEPCNECEQCREITAGNSFNVIEIDAASNRGIDSIRELREKVMVRPSTGKYKIYILDEAHMLTTEAFNALLKTLEEPPEHAIFVMATTDVHKMLPTVISRCQRFDFKRITTRQIVAHLQFVAKQEHIELEQGAAELIARAAAGGMRDALSLLDQAIAYSGQSISLAQVQTMLGVADPRAIQKFVTYIAQLDSAAGLHLIHELTEAGADLRQINTQVAEYWRDMMLVKAGADIATILDSTQDEIHEITQTAKHFGLDELTDCARIFAQNELMQKNQGTPQLGLELALLTAIERHRHAHPSQSSPPTQPARSEVTSSPRAATPPAHTPPVLRPTPVQPEPVPASTNRGEQESVELDAKAAQIEEAREKSGESAETSDELPDWEMLSYADNEEEYEDVSEVSTTATTRERIAEVTPISTPEVVSSPQASQMNEEAVNAVEQESDVQEDRPTFTLADVKEKWEQIKRRVKTRKEGAIVASVLNDFAVVAVQGTANEAVIVAQAAHDWHYKRMQQGDHSKVIEWALKIELRQECRIKFLSPEQSVTLPPPLPFSLYRSSGPSSTNETSLSAHGTASPTLNKSDGSRSTQRQSEQPAKQQGQQGQLPTNSRVKEYEDGPATTPPLARNHIVRENITSSPRDNGSRGGNGGTHHVDGEEPSSVIESLATMPTLSREESVASVESVASEDVPFIVDETRRAQLERKVKADPVVQKVTEMFKASVKDVQPK